MSYLVLLSLSSVPGMYSIAGTSSCLWNLCESTSDSGCLWGFLITRDTSWFTLSLSLSILAGGISNLVYLGGGKYLGLENSKFS